MAMVRYPCGSSADREGQDVSPHGGQVANVALALTCAACLVLFAAQGEGGWWIMPHEKERLGSLSITQLLLQTGGGRVL